MKISYGGNPVGCVKPEREDLLGLPDRESEGVSWNWSPLGEGLSLWIGGTWRASTPVLSFPQFLAPSLQLLYAINIRMNFPQEPVPPHILLTFYWSRRDRQLDNPAQEWYPLLHRLPLTVFHPASTFILVHILLTVFFCSPCFLPTYIWYWGQALILVYLSPYLSLINTLSFFP